MVTFCSLPVALSLALTLTIPLASMSNVTSIWGTPRGAGGTPTRSNWPRILLSAAISRSPCNTLMPTCVWLSAAVENVWLFLVGIVVLRLIKRVNTPPRVSIPSESGVTSKRRISLTSPRRTPPWMAAPMATTSSGFTPLLGSRPKSSFTMVCTLGMRDIPPTRRTSEISPVVIPASLTQFLHGCLVRSRRPATRSSSLARVSVIAMCFGPVASAVMKGKLMSVDCAEDNSILAFSAASRRRCTASLSPFKSMPCSFLNVATNSSRRTVSKSSPPKKVSPFVALTSKTPPEISRMETSKVPPPKSYTATKPSFLSTPYESAAAVGSLMIRSTSRPAIFPASFVA
mmetsp:Transcript_458/g.1376  ORF Transcript_458/g.1376 Transcript_458/m.1376 type:complete len:344 (+) Transcript_458:693-1724(+)